jgi:hypothetical protein
VNEIPFVRVYLLVEGNDYIWANGAEWAAHPYIAAEALGSVDGETLESNVIPRLGRSTGTRRVCTREQLRGFPAGRRALHDWESGDASQAEADLRQMYDVDAIAREDQREGRDLYLIR